MDEFKDEPIYVGGRMVGKVITFIPTNETWFLTVREPKHYFIKYRGYGMAQEVVNMLIERKIPMIKLIYRGKTTIMYKAKPETFRDKGTPVQIGEFEPQFILNEDSFDSVER